ncbi:amidohydrolase family protein [Paraliomyxa miuraensis]|uniref:amidohydrolase family protein n=1 Tax=Paraliomyxa miuraensis TaxID=376150 RepID=UPI00225BE9CE|nr:amidohydrolase family protein [Paraliomyxa miuraensis]MCX4243519.1 amidohydrolase family protein [Paraliomyxa miuraensis]
MIQLQLRPRPLRLRLPLAALVLAVVTLVLLGAGSASRAAPASARATRTSRSPARTPQVLPLPFDRAEGDAVFLVGARIHVGDGTIIEDGVVELRGARIAAVGGSDRMSAIPAEATRIDLAGKLLTPGIIAAHTQLGLVEIDLEGSTVDAERNGGSPVRAGYDASMAINADSSLIQVSAIEGITSAAVTPRGGLLSGQVAWIDLLAGDHRGIVARPRIAAAGQLGHALAGSRAEAFAGLLEVLDDARFYRDRRTAHERRELRDLAAHRLDLDALGSVLDGQVPLVVYADRASDLLALAELAKSTGMRVAVVGGAQGWKVADALAEADIPVIVQPSANLPDSLDQIGARMDNAALLHQAGARVGIAVLGEAHNVRNVTQEAGIAVANGLPAEVALRAVTLELARIYGMDDHYGSIAPGKVANLVIWDGDPFELSQWPVAVWVRGQPIPMRSRQTLLRDRYRVLDRFGEDRDE